MDTVSVWRANAAIGVFGAAQCRMARAALRWSLDEMAKAAGVSYRTIFRLENEPRDIQAEKVAAIRRAFEAAGVRFIDASADAGAVVPPTLRLLPR